MRQIEHIVEPDRLLLSWQRSDRLRRIVAELVRNGDDANLVYLKDSDEFSKSFCEAIIWASAALST